MYGQYNQRGKNAIKWWLKEMRVMMMIDVMRMVVKDDEDVLLV